MRLLQCICTAFLAVQLADSAYFWEPNEDTADGKLDLAGSGSPSYEIKYLVSDPQPRQDLPQEFRITIEELERIISQSEDKDTEQQPREFVNGKGPRLVTLPELKRVTNNEPGLPPGEQIRKESRSLGENEAALPSNSESASADPSTADPAEPVPSEPAVTTAEDATSDGTTLEDTTPEATPPEDTTSEATTLEDTTSEATTSDDTTTEAITTEATTPDDTATEATTTDDTATDDTTPQGTTLKPTAPPPTKPRPSKPPTGPKPNGQLPVICNLPLFRLTPLCSPNRQNNGQSSRPPPPAPQLCFSIFGRRNCRRGTSPPAPPPRQKKPSSRGLFDRVVSFSRSLPSAPEEKPEDRLGSNQAQPDEVF